MSGLFITGTDTGVGKTEVTLALMAALQQQGQRVLGMKPVASGAIADAPPTPPTPMAPPPPALALAAAPIGATTTGLANLRAATLTPGAGPAALRNDDALRLLAQGNRPLPYELINPYAFAPPIAPHIAAGLAGVEIQLETITMAYRALDAQADWVLVEGVGGWRVPLGPRLNLSDLPAALGLPVILVVGLRLGCLNHALLTCEAIRHDGLRLAGWVANLLDPLMLVREENLATLATLIDAPLLGSLPWLPEPSTATLAAALDVRALLAG